MFFHLRLFRYPIPVFIYGEYDFSFINCFHLDNNRMLYTLSGQSDKIIDIYHYGRTKCTRPNKTRKHLPVELFSAVSAKVSLKR